MRQVAQSIMLIVAICLIHRVLDDFDWVNALLGGFLIGFYHMYFFNKEKDDGRD